MALLQESLRPQHPLWGLTPKTSFQGRPQRYLVRVLMEIANYFRAPCFAVLGNKWKGKEVGVALTVGMSDSKF